MKIKKGIKYDKGKVRVDLLNAAFVTEMAAVVTHGGMRHGLYNWINLGVDRVVPSLSRHLLKCSVFRRNANTEDFNGLEEVYVGVNAMFLWFLISKINNDSVKSNKHSERDETPSEGLKNLVKQGYVMYELLIEEFLFEVAKQATVKGNDIRYSEGFHYNSMMSSYYQFKSTIFTDRNNIVSGEKKFLPNIMFNAMRLWEEKNNSLQVNIERLPVKLFKEYSLSNTKLFPF